MPRNHKNKIIKIINLTIPLACFFVFHQAIQLVQAQKVIKVQRIMTDQELKHLSIRISKSEVQIQRQGTAKKGYHFPKKRQELGKGISLSSTLFLTSSYWLKLRPDEGEVYLSLFCPYITSNGKIAENTNPPAIKAKVIDFSYAQGWALLKSEQHTNCMGSDIRPLSQNFLEQSFYIGSRVYLFEPKPLNPAQLSILGQARAPMDYYWYSTGHMQPGTPLYNHEGLLITLSVMSDPSSTSTQTLILPPIALAEATARAKLLLQQQP